MNRFNHRIGLWAICMIATACIDNDPAGNRETRRTAVLIPMDSIKEDRPMMSVAKELASFGGFYFDDQKRIVIALTRVDDFSRARQLVAPRLAGRAVAGFVVREVEYSFLELAQYRTLLRREIFKIDGVVSLGVKESQNRIRIGIAEAAAEDAVKALMERLRVPAQMVTFIQMPYPKLASHNLRNYQPDNQIQGAWKIFYYLHPGCTAGFSLRWHNAAWQDVFIINTHCTPTQAGYDPGTAFYQGGGPTDQDGQLWGYEIVDPAPHDCGYPGFVDDCRNADAAMISGSVPIQLGKIARTTASAGCEDCLQPLTIDHSNPTLTISSKGDDTYENEELHKIGMTSGWTYGDVEDTCDDVELEDLVRECTDRVDFSLHDGDSGAPVFQLKANGTVELRGIAWGRVHGIYNDAYISDIHQIELDLGELIVYDPGPMAITISGPTSVTGSETCAWIATITGGMKPISGTWSGVLSDTFGGASGNGASVQITGTVTSSGFLTLQVTDYYNRTASKSEFISIDPNAQNNCYN